MKACDWLDKPDLEGLEPNERHGDELGGVGVVGHRLLPQPGVYTTGRLGEVVIQI